MGQGFKDMKKGVPPQMSNLVKIHEIPVGKQQLSLVRRVSAGAEDPSGRFS